jgi:hypothetical protein
MRGVENKKTASELLDRIEADLGKTLTEAVREKIATIKPIDLITGCHDIDAIVAENIILRNKLNELQFEFIKFGLNFDRRNFRQK